MKRQSPEMKDTSSVPGDASHLIFYLYSSEILGEKIKWVNEQICRDQLGGARVSCLSRSNRVLNRFPGANRSLKMFNNILIEELITFGCAKSS